MPHIDVLIVGGGLSGVMLAWKLENRRDKPASSYRLLEARSALGGRLANDNGVHNEIDLGAAWMWPTAQPLMRKLVIQDLRLETIQQSPERMYASTSRIVGGAVQVVRSMAEGIPKEKIQLNAPVTRCELLHDSNEVQVTFGDSTNTSNSIRANKVVFAVPPRMLEKHVTFVPELSPTKQRAISSSNTWMAGVTKVALVYPEKWWENDDDDDEDFPFYALVGRFPGGKEEQPAFQIYDASTQNVNALTAFTLASAPALQDDQKLADLVARQFDQAWRYQRRSASPALSFSSFYIQRWPLEGYISENERPLEVKPHPHPVRALSEPEWDGKLLFGGTESDLSSPGVMEGAVGAAIRCYDQLQF